MDDSDGSGEQSLNSKNNIFCYIKDDMVTNRYGWTMSFCDFLRYFKISALALVICFVLSTDVYVDKQGSADTVLLDDLAGTTNSDKYKITLHTGAIFVFAILWVTAESCVRVIKYVLASCKMYPMGPNAPPGIAGDL